MATTFYCYISTGAKSAMFTLWRGRESDDPHVNMFLRDHYVCNLAAAGDDVTGETKEQLAERKATDYAERMSRTMGQPVIFRGFYDEPFNLRRGKLSVQDTHALEAIERGVFPFGKHRDTLITDAPDGYIMWWSDQHTDRKPVVAALAAVCMGVAMERDLIAKREAARCERAAADAASEFVGTIGERQTFTGEVVTLIQKGDDPAWGTTYFITKVRCDGNLIVAIGKKFAERGETITFKATIKDHNEYQGVKSTRVNRPKVQG